MREKVFLTLICLFFLLLLSSCNSEKNELAIKVALLEKKDSISDYNDSLRLRWRKAEMAKVNKLEQSNLILKKQVLSVNEKLKKTDKIIWTVVEKTGKVEMTNSKNNFQFKMSVERQQALATIWKLCCSVEKRLRERKVLASIALVESNGLEGRGYKEGNNFCNIKHFDGQAGKVVCPFPSLCKGSVNISDDHARDRFCKYVSPKMGLVACNRLLHNGRYKLIWDKKINTSAELLKAIDVLGFATAGNHAEMTMAVDYFLKDYK